MAWELTAWYPVSPKRWMPMPAQQPIEIAPRQLVKALQHRIAGALPDEHEAEGGLATKAKVADQLGVPVDIVGVILRQMVKDGDVCLSLAADSDTGAPCGSGYYLVGAREPGERRRSPADEREAMKNKVAVQIAFAGRCRHDVCKDAHDFWANSSGADRSTAFRQADAAISTLNHGWEDVI